MTMTTNEALEVIERFNEAFGRHDVFASSPGASFEAEEVIGAGERAVVRWVYRWTGADGAEGHVRGIDAFRVRDGKVAEKASYVKG